MVYDASRNFLGDTYWKESDELHEGDELSLDKGVMVEVSEAIGTTQTDLTPLFEKKTKESPRRKDSAAGQPLPPKSTGPTRNSLRSASQLRHKSLNTLLGTSKGPVGKAVPMKSPFDERKEKENEHIQERSSKRQKMIHEPVTLIRPGPTAAQDTPLKTESSTTSKLLPSDGPSLPVAYETTVIDLDSEPDNILSDVTLPSPLGPLKMTCQSKVTTSLMRKQSTAEKHVLNATPKLPKGKIPLPHTKAQQISPPREQPSSPPVSASNRLANLNVAIEAVSDMPKELPQTRKMKALRLSTGVKRGTLMCQAVPRHSNASSSETRSRNGSLGQGAGRAHTDTGGSCSPTTNVGILRANKAKPNGEDASKRSHENPSIHGRSKHDRADRQQQQAFQDTSDDMEYMHGIMDQRLQVMPSPSDLDKSAELRSNSPRRRKPPDSTSAADEKVRGKRKLQDTSIELEHGEKRNSAPMKNTTNKIRAKRKKEQQRDKPPVICIRSTSPIQVPEHLEGSPRCSSATLEPTEEHFISKNLLNSPKSSSSNSFKKTLKRGHGHVIASEVEMSSPHPITAALPPHPLRSKKSGLIMSTAGLSALLQKGPKSVQLGDDPIEDCTQEDKNASPNRSFRRSKSENDAPIPSTSEEWEERNLSRNLKPTLVTRRAQTTGVSASRPKVAGLALLVKKTDPRRKIHRTQSLNATENALNTEESLAVPPIDDDVGPWSTEAFDLFDWRPPQEGVDSGTGLLVDEKQL